MVICVIGARGFPDYIGGIESVCKSLYSELVELDTEVEIVILTRNKQVKTDDYVANRKIKVKVIPTINISGIETTLHSLLSVLYAYIFISPSLIHFHGIGPGFFTGLAKFLGFKVIVTHHAPDYDRPKWGRFAKWFLVKGEYYSVKYADKVICVSQYVQDLLLSKYANLDRRTITIRNGGSLTSHTSRPNLTGYSHKNSILKDYFLFVGRLEETKAIEDLIIAFNLSNSAKKLLIVGDSIDNDSYRDYLKSIANQNTIFVGTKYGDELFYLYQNAFLVVNPSIMEGYCLVVAEAISLGTPVLLSDIPPHQEFKLPKDSFFVPRDITQLASKLSECNNQRFISDQAIDYQMKNTWRKNAQRHLAIYRSISAD